MANQNIQTQTKEQQDKQSQGKAMTSGSETSGTASRRSNDPFGLLFPPTEFLLMNPFSLMRRMTESVATGSNEANDLGAWMPAIEVTQKDGQLVVHADLPGMKPEDVKLEVAGDTLVIEGERKCERKEDKGDIHRTEVRYGRFFRTIPLPENAKVEQAKASFDNGVLEISIPVEQQANDRKQIPIQSASAGSAKSGGSVAA
jgi:HSP20 family protein